MSEIGPRVRLTGVKDSGPVWIWINHVTSVFKFHRDKDFTVVTVAGLRDPHAVTESVDRVLELIDDAAAGMPQDGGRFDPVSGATT